VPQDPHFFKFHGLLECYLGFLHLLNLLNSLTSLWIG